MINFEKINQSVDTGNDAGVSYVTLRHRGIEAINGSIFLVYGVSCLTSFPCSLMCMMGVFSC